VSALAARATDTEGATALAAPKVLISNGTNRFHLAVAAAEVARYGRLAGILTGAYPTPRVARFVHALGLDRQQKLARLIDRGEDIPANLVKPLWQPELLGQLGALARSGRADWLSKLFDDAALRTFARGAGRRLRSIPPDARLYHYRSGFGLASVTQAKDRGLIALCDHSIVHPLSLGELLGRSRARLPRPWKTVLRDLEHADHILVNSEFVKSTFLEHGWDTARIDVIYLGVDDAFLATSPERQTVPYEGETLRLLFAGAFERRKGVDALVSALSCLDDVPWQLKIAGGFAPEARRTHRRFLEDPRVSLLGTLSRGRLAQTMGASDIFVFPTLAEGSARVVFEALACGLYVITTPNAGSIVEDGVHGTLVAPHSPEALAEALRRAATDRGALRKIGRRNAALIRRRYRQRDYGCALLELYGRLAEAAP
jgi:glycosyltransferase involved in cell wall biosynthesis